MLGQLTRTVLRMNYTVGQQGKWIMIIKIIIIIIIIANLIVINFNRYAQFRGTSLSL
jgi:uncharacterized integral membrane protein